MTVNQALREWGLGVNEVKVYLACLGLGSSTRAQIQKKTRLPESTTKDNLKFLREKGLVRRPALKDNYTPRYEASNPQLLVDKLNKQLAGIKAIIPELRNITNSHR